MHMHAHRLAHPHARTYSLVAYDGSSADSALECVERLTDEELEHEFEARYIPQPGICVCVCTFRHNQSGPLLQNKTFADARDEQESILAKRLEDEAAVAHYKYMLTYPGLGSIAGITLCMKTFAFDPLHLEMRTGEALLQALFEWGLKHKYQDAQQRIEQATELFRENSGWKSFEVKKPEAGKKVPMTPPMFSSTTTPD